MTASDHRRRWPSWARAARYLAPIALGLLLLGGWEWAVAQLDVPTYVVPAPSAVRKTLTAQWPTLAAAWLVTLKTMLLALAAAVVGGVALAVLFTLSRTAELSLFPYAVILQVTPLVAVAPLLTIWIEQVWLVQLLCAWIVAFFPILSSTAVGLRSATEGHRELFQLYGASPWKRLRWMLAPTALPYFLTGLRTALNLSLVGTVVAEFVTGANGEKSGLAAAVFEGQYRLDTPLMFAALGLISLTGIVGYFATHTLSHFLLKDWHESAT